MAGASDIAFHEFVRARMDRWRRSAFLLCQDWHDADDLVSVTVAKLYRSWSKVARADNPDAYAQRVLTRCWLTERKRSGRHREQPHADPPDRLVEAPDRLGDRELLATALRTLGPRQRAVVVLRFYLDCSVEETAAILRIAPGTVKSQSARGLEALKSTTLRSMP